jgi:hypothetical protein
MHGQMCIFFRLYFIGKYPSAAVRASFFARRPAEVVWAEFFCKACSKIVDYDHGYAAMPRAVVTGRLPVQTVNTLLSITCENRGLKVLAGKIRYFLFWRETKVNESRKSVPHSI